MADKLSGEFVDGDDLHSQANVDKMRRGIALTDDDRWPWLERVAKVLREHDGEIPLIVSCSALKSSYRRRLGENYHLIYLKGTLSEIAARLQARQLQESGDHFMPISLLESQFDTLEEPDDAIVLDPGQPPHEMAEKIIRALLYVNAGVKTHQWPE